MLLLAPAVLFATVLQNPIVTPYSRRATLALHSVTGPAKIEQYGVEQLDLDVDGTYDNPFDPADVAIDAEVTPPSGKPYSVPGFLYRFCERDLAGEKEIVTPRGAAEWKVRICPREAGKYRVAVRLKDRTGSVSKPFQFEASASADPGFVEVSPRDRRYFEFDKGGVYFPIGANVCWASARGTYDYDDWLPKYGKNGCNYLRLWLSPHWTTLALEKPGKPEEGGGMGQFDLADAWKLDYVLDLARKNGMYAMLCIDSYNILRNKDAYPQWENTPHNKDNGGPLRIWSDFWTNPEMDRLYKNKLRYLVARYGAYTHVLAWEFWNEVDLVRDFDAELVRGWHQRMATYLKALDPYHHMLSTSFSDSMGVRSIDQLPELDFVQTHLYNSPDLAWGVARQQSRKTDWAKPHYVGEIGADGGGPKDKEDPTGLQIHDPLWVSVASGCAGGAMSWWWDSLIAPHDLYGLYGSLSRFVSGIDFPGEKFQQIDATLSFADPAGKTGRVPLSTWSLAGNDSALVWLRHAERTWRTVIVQKRQTTPVPPVNLVLPGLATGVWRVELWDTWAGKPTSSTRVQVGLDGKARVLLPTIATDLAVKLTRQRGAGGR